MRPRCYEIAHPARAQPHSRVSCRFGHHDPVLTEEVSPVKVIGAGFGRTGTMSLKVALEELGAGPCLHSLESLRAGDSGAGASHWERLANGERIDWREALAGWGSTVDWLGARFYGEILDAWPEAKVILSVREPQAWYESCSASLHATRGLVGTRPAGTAPAVLEAVEGAIWQGVFDGRFPDRDYALQVFHRHRRNVMETVPAARLLIYDIGDGWEPLCAFLEVPVPETPFPHLNGRTAFWTRFGVNVVADSAAPLPPTPSRSAAATARSPGTLAPVGKTTSINGLALADPERSFTQTEVLSLMGLDGDEFAEGVFQRCGVKRRRLDLDHASLATTLQGRTPNVEGQLMGYAIDAVEKLCVDPHEIGTVVSATLYSLGCPSLAHRLVEHFQMDPRTDKYHVVGVGCASAVPLVRLAAQALQGHPGKKALVLGAESMSGLLASACEQDSRSKTVGSSIFGDGCAAMVLDGSADAEGPQVIASCVHQIPDTLGAVRLELAPDDSYLHLAKELPDVAGEHMRALVDDFLREAGLTGHMVDHWIIHPGGRRILERAQQAMSLCDEDVAVSFDVLANHGNVGTPSIFYVLHETIAQRRPQAGQHGLLVTIGPGVTIGLMLLRWPG
jgi:predicted naringenin-chalcone synthase